MKKVATLLLCIMLIFSVLPVSASAVQTTIQTGGTDGDWNYTLADGKATEVYCAGTTLLSGSVTIPFKLDGYPVTSIGAAAFFGKGGITSITIPNSVTAIGSNAFNGCLELTAINIPDSITYIGDNAFRFCMQLISVEIPNSITLIGSGLFSYCSALTSVSLPESITSIGDQAFSNCTALSSITIPEGVGSIGVNAFLSVPGVSYYSSCPAAVTAASVYAATTPWSNLGVPEVPPTVLTQNQTEVGESDMPIVVSAEPAVFKVKVPLSFPVHVSSEGVVTVATNAALTNESSYGKINVKSFTLVAENGWSCLDYGTDFSTRTVNEKVFGFVIISGVTDLNPNMETGLMTDTGGTVGAWGVAKGIGAPKPLNYKVKVAPQSAGLVSESIASVVIVVGWST